MLLCGDDTIATVNVVATKRQSVGAFGQNGQRL